jgi:hypothetical protein
VPIVDSGLYPAVPDGEGRIAFEESGGLGPHSRPWKRLGLTWSTEVYAILGNISIIPLSSRKHKFHLRRLQCSVIPSGDHGPWVFRSGSWPLMGVQAT